MTRSKLSDSDREELIRLFRETTETITSLADRFQVSISTARRVLKTQLSAEDYEAIVANRLEGRQNRKYSKNTAEPDRQVQASPKETPAAAVPPIQRPQRRSRHRASGEEVAQVSETTQGAASVPEREPTEPSHADPWKETAETPLKETTETPLTVLPIDTATLPNQCYLVVDRAAELITPPLREFSELGTIPMSEEAAKTLPIFANHKVASRFSRRSQRIIKIPNSEILKKTYPMLTAKGVERILFDGQVFSLAHSS